MINKVRPILAVWMVGDLGESEARRVLALRGIRSTTIVWIADGQAFMVPTEDVQQHDIETWLHYWLRGLKKKHLRKATILERYKDLCMMDISYIPGLQVLHMHRVVALATI